MLSSLLRSLSPRSPSGAAQSPPRNVAADTKSLIELRDAVQYSDANNVVLLDGKGVSAAGTPPRSPLSPAFLRRKQASAAKTRIADRFARALPPGTSQDQAATPFNNLTDAGAVRVHQLRLLTALVKLQQDLIAGGMNACQAAELSTLAFTPATWNCSDTQALYDRINSCLISSNQRIVHACLDASRRADPPKDEAAWRLELETASGAITQRRRSQAPPPDAAAVASSDASPPTRVDRKPHRAPDAEGSRIVSGDDRKASRRLSNSGTVSTSEPRSAAGAPGPLSSVNRSLASEFSGAATGTAPPPPAEIHPTLLATALPTRGAPSTLASTEPPPLANQLSSIPMDGSPSAGPSAGGRPAHQRSNQGSESERARLADTKGRLIGLSSPEQPTRLADLSDWRKGLAAEALCRDVPDMSARQASAQANTQAREQAREQAAFRVRWHSDWLPALLGLHERVTRASGQPLSNPFRDELLCWPLSVRASLLLCSADSLQSMDPRGAAWALRYRFHAELARALAVGECYTAQEQQLQARVLGAVQAQARARKPATQSFQSVVADVSAIFIQASRGRGSAEQGLPSFELRMDSLKRRQARYNPFTRMVHIGPQFLHGQSPMPYVLRHVAAASMHFYNHRLIDAVSANKLNNDNPDWQIGSMLHALEQVPITAEDLKRAGLQPKQANLLVLQTLPKQRELSFARAVKDAWESARRDTLGRSLAQGGGRQGVWTMAQRPASVIQESVISETGVPASAMATESQALPPTALASAASTAARVVTNRETEDTGEGLGFGA